ncbi:MAG: 3-octaprenyl-4-hydroxybenzoate carboxy-lyase [Bacteroidetes bacterium RIFCSPLOWO2_12_FULL_35_15]|nr:MAG: 3-octaprenyl-4-hydroxybenzoate carboxy-lyase [Bacteroidetes bacterium RIFCSPLOWO2_12_FULL_35_15]
MGYKSTEDCINDLEKHGYLIRIKEEVDPELEMAAIHLRVFEHNGPALLFENIKGCKFKAVSNIYGTLDRSKFIFRDTLEKIKILIDLKNDPIKAIKHPLKYANIASTAFSSLPKRSGFSNPVLQNQTSVSSLPQIKCWPNDGGAFITLPLVYTEDIDKPGVMNSNLGMYRIQLNGNEYINDKEIGLHYQLHRGIGVHQTKSNAKGQPLKVSIFVGGPPALTLAGVMPLPEGMSELTFAGALGNRRIRYTYEDDFCIASDADFVITGEIYPNETKPEGPFGDHLGYYSLTHNFPVMRVHKVFHRTNAIWPFTVVGRPPQEDTSFGALIHDLTGNALPKEIPGLRDIHAVDAAGVHPLLLAIGSERYTPFAKERKPQEILTIANHILGSGQLSLAKYLFIVAGEDDPDLTTHNMPAFFNHVLERVDWTRDLHFQTRTTIDTLDYSGTNLNSGSKVVIAVAGDKKRKLSGELLSDFSLPGNYTNPRIVMPGIIAITGPKFSDQQKAEEELAVLTSHLKGYDGINLHGFPLIIVCDDSDFLSANLNNFLWATFTRSNPSHDIYGTNSFVHHKHWGCKGSLIIDARIKTHHAPLLIKDLVIEKRVDALRAKGKSLHGII